MQTGVTPKATDDRRDFVVIPPDQVRVAPSDAEITDLLRAAARHHSEAGPRAASDSSTPVPMVDATFRATVVNDDVRARRSSFGRQAIRVIAAIVVATGLGLGWQLFGYAAKSAVGHWLPQLALITSLPLDKLGLGPVSTPSDDPANATPEPAAAPAQSTAENDAPESAAPNAAALPSDAAQQLQSMARDLANANQEVETLKASIAELKASQQQMARDLAKISEQNAKAKIAAAAPHPPVVVRKPAPLYSPTPTAATPPPVYRPAPSYSAQAAVVPGSPPAGTAQPYVPPPPISLQPQTEPGLVSAPRPPMPVQ